jgi:hypothetical protein
METKTCPKCGKKMIKRYTNEVLTSYPPQYPWNWWCGGCGHTERGGIERGRSMEDGYQQAWEAANKDTEKPDTY